MKKKASAKGGKRLAKKTLSLDGYLRALGTAADAPATSKRHVPNLTVARFHGLGFPRRGTP